MEHFLRTVGEHGRVLVGHNVAFDRNVVAAEMYRLGYTKEAVENGFYATRHLCLMTTAGAFCRLPGRFGRPKYPTLVDLHMKPFGGEPRGVSQGSGGQGGQCALLLSVAGVGGDLMNSRNSEAKSPGAADGD